MRKSTFSLLPPMALAACVALQACGSDGGGMCDDAETLAGDYRVRLSNFRDCNGPVPGLGPTTQVFEIDPRMGRGDEPGCATLSDNFSEATCLLRRAVECPATDSSEGFLGFIDVQFFEDGTIEGLTETTFTTGPTPDCTVTADLSGNKL